MKVLLTGASGFVGSHVLDVLHARNIPTAVLLRTSSNRAFLKDHLSKLEARTGSITEKNTLTSALQGITHVVHCAGCTKAGRPSDYRTINHEGTANLVEAVNAHAGHVRKLVHLSSLAVAGPATAEAPAREDAVPKPVSEYGRTKLAGEEEVRNRAQVPWTILRPPAVYGPRDSAFLPMFRAVKHHVLPGAAKRQALSLVFARDLAEAVVACLEQPKSARKTYYVASREVVTAQGMARVIAATMGVRTFTLPLPAVLLWLICLLQESFSRLTGRATLLNLQKFAELRAPGWVCDPSQGERDLGLMCGTRLSSGIPETILWYRRHKWL